LELLDDRDDGRGFGLVALEAADLQRVGNVPSMMDATSVPSQGTAPMQRPIMAPDM
jgi:hypothetical protein